VNNPASFLAGVLNPTAVAVIGASDTPAKAGGRVVYNLISCGFEGRILPVNPARSTALGLPCFPSISDVPGPPPELAFVAVPGSKLAAALTECAAAGVKCCVANANGFAEIDEGGAIRQAELREITRSTGIRLIGPNCLGVVTSRCSLNLTSGWTLSEKPAIGNIGVISQSGSMMMYLYHRAADLGAGITSGLSIGNQADLELSDFIEAMVADPSTSAICAYVEGLKDPQRFLRAADLCVAAGKPLLVLKTGRTASGASITRSHTASLTSGTQVFSAACRDHGVILADDPDAMIRTAAAVSAGSLPQARGVAVFSGSGGGLAIALDRVAEAGLEIPALTPDIRRRLGEHLLLPSELAALDLGRTPGGSRTVPVGEVAGTLASDPQVGVVIFCLTVMPYMLERTLEAAEAVRRAGKLFMPTLFPGSAGDTVKAGLEAAGFRTYEHIDDALRLITTWTAILDRPAAPQPARRPGLDPGVAARLQALPAGALTEPEAKTVLEWYGITPNRGEVVTSADEAVSAAQRLGYPVAVKLVSRQVVHKSDAGGVRLGLADAAAVRAACNQIAAAVRTIEPSPGYSVQEMVPPGTELIVGVTTDEQFGAVVTVGFGGTLTELVRDVSVSPAPVSESAALRMLQRLRMWPLLTGARGAAPRDVAAVAAAISRLSWLGADLGDRLVEFEINPLIALESAALAVDARSSLS
jgi:acyl-CoA synthetase (NDP forming)